MSNNKSKSINEVMVSLLMGAATLDGWLVRSASSLGRPNSNEGQSVFIEIMDEKRAEYFESQLYLDTLCHSGDTGALSPIAECEIITSPMASEILTPDAKENLQLRTKIDQLERELAEKRAEVHDLIKANESLTTSLKLYRSADKEPSVITDTEGYRMIVSVELNLEHVLKNAGIEGNAELYGYMRGFIPDMLSTASGVVSTLAYKNYMYGNDNIVNQGDDMLITRLGDKAARLKRLATIGTTASNDEGPIDTWKDAAGYALIGYAKGIGNWTRAIRQGQLTSDIYKKPKRSDN